MADILISRQDYRDAAQRTAGAAAQYNGWEANTNSGAITGTAMTANTDYTIPADFKDHKTVFVISNAGSSAATVTFKKGNTYGAQDVAVTAPAGISLVWLDSAKFADKETGIITVKSSANITMFGYEMR